MYPYDALKVYIDGVDETWLRLNSWSEGFRSENLSVSFAAGQIFSLSLRFVRHQYKFEVEGPIEVVRKEGSGDNVCSLEIRWSQEGRRNGAATAVIRLVNMDFPERPSVFSLLMGEASIMPSSSMV